MRGSEFKDLNSSGVRFYSQLSIFKAKQWLAKIIQKIKLCMLEFPPKGPLPDIRDPCRYIVHHSQAHVQPDPSVAGFPLVPPSTRPRLQGWWRTLCKDGKTTTSHWTTGARNLSKLRATRRKATLTLCPISPWDSPQAVIPECERRGTEHSLFLFTKLPHTFFIPSSYLIWIGKAF